MKKIKLFILLFAICITQIVRAQKEIAINFCKPYQYQTIAGQLVAKAWLKVNELGQDFAITLNDKEFSFTKTDSGTVELFLPLVCKAGELVFYSNIKSNKRVLAKQVFNPLVSSDWGYF